MRPRFQPPMMSIAAALLGAVALLGVLQYRWLGHVSDAERDRITATLNTRAGAFAEDFDREITLAFMLFQMEPLAVMGADDTLGSRLAARLQRWHASASHPRLIKDCYVILRSADEATLQWYDAATSSLQPAEWPDALLEIRSQVGAPPEEVAGRMIVRTLASPLWETVPALLIQSPLVRFGPPQEPEAFRIERAHAFIVLVLDAEYIAQEMLPALAVRHFRDTDGLTYGVAVVNATTSEVVYRSTPGFDAAGPADVSAELFQLRVRDFPQLAADVRRFIATLQPSQAAAGQAYSLMVQTGVPPPAPRGSATWRLMAVHPAGSLEAAVAHARRRNLLVSGGVLVVLAASIGLLVASARRSQELARQQMEFVATVTHELRTPLAVIRSAGDNLADGTVRDEAQIRRYGALVRSEGRRLTAMVEQVLELAGMQSGARALSVSPVPLADIVGRVLETAAPTSDAARVRIELDIPADLPPIAADAEVLARAFQNLVDNAIKYGERGGWIGIDARRSGAEVQVTIRDRGIGIAPADQARIFEPFYRAADVVAAQIQGAGLGLSLVSRIIQAHGGRIAVKSAPGQGSSFIVHLPLAAGRVAETHATAATGPAAPTDSASPHPRAT